MWLSFPSILVCTPQVRGSSSQLYFKQTFQADIYSERIFSDIKQMLQIKYNNYDNY